MSTSSRSESKGFASPSQSLENQVSLARSSPTHSSLESFVHDPLDLTQATIRVLRILPGSEAAPISCVVKHVPRGDDTYVCLSYSWGEPDDGHSIRLNGRLFQVRASLFNFLQCARKLEISDWLWIDAICINQTDNLEKNHQVQQMSEIYRGAKHVLVYPGNVSGSLKVAARLTRCVRKREVLNGRYNGRSCFVRAYRRAIFNMFSKSLVQGSQYPYWDRAWIIQEILLSAACFMITQSGVVRWDHFEHLYGPGGLNAIARCPLPGRFLASTINPSTIQLYGLSRAGLLDLYSKYHRAPSTFSTRAGSDHPECSDVRDQVYSLLGLAGDASRFKVDYYKTPATLFLDTLEHFLLTHTDFQYAGDFILSLAASLKIMLYCYCVKCAGSSIRAPQGVAEPSVRDDATQMLFLVQDNTLWSESLKPLTSTRCHVCGEHTLFEEAGSSISFKYKRVDEHRMWVVVQGIWLRGGGNPYA